jgi:UDP-N-acetylmuramoyl-L-alanyl-D-glutamate--2,6-diaminopimelate ligase
MITPFGRIPMWSPMIGQVNVYNALAASAAGYARDCPLGPIAKGIFDLARVPGRFERVECGQPFTVAVDYAHTDDALRNLTALAHDFVARAGSLGKSSRSSVVAATHRAKRPLMGEAAGKGSLRGSHIRQPAFRGSAGDHERCTRGLQVRRDFTMSPRPTQPRPASAGEPCDIVPLAGKGHEKVQVTRGNHPARRRRGGSESLKTPG